MNNENGFIVLHRKMLEWEWFGDPNTVIVWLYLLLKANWKPSRWKGIEIGRGQTIESVSKIAKATGLSVRNVRTALFHLKSTGEVTTEVTRYGTLISILQYSKYQDISDLADKEFDKGIDKRPTSDRQATDNTRTIYNNNNKNNNIEECVNKINYKGENEKNITEETSFTPPTLDEIKAFVSENELLVDPQYFFEYYNDSGWKENWKARIRRWDKEDRSRQQQTQTSTNAVVSRPSYMQTNMPEDKPASAELQERIRKLQEGIKE